MRLRYVLVLLVMMLMTACGSAPQDTSEATLEPGDAVRGEALFTQVVNGAPACSTCHTTDGSALVGPSLQGFAEVAQTRVEGTSGEDYTHTSIVRPAAFVVSGFPNAMYPQYERSLSPQQIADLVAYLLTL